MLAQLHPRLPDNPVRTPTTSQYPQLLTHPKLQKEKIVLDLLDNPFGIHPITLANL
jgi:hypothetical protein